MKRRPFYTATIFTVAVVLGVFVSFWPPDQHTQRMWLLISVLGLNCLGIPVLLLERRAIARANRPKHLCANCNYDLSGISPTTACPECGAGIKNVCIRCRNDMTGIEHRACPTCGVIYGTEPLSKT